MVVSIVTVAGTGQDLARIQEQLGLELQTFATLEAQVASISDDVAYDCHDLEDGLRAGLLDLQSLDVEPLLLERPSQAPAKKR